MNLNKFSYFLLFFCFLLGLASCSSDSNDLPDVSQSQLDFEVKRFDQDLFALDTTNMEASLDALKKKYPEFYPFFVNTLMEWGQDNLTNDASILDAKLTTKKIKDFISHQDIKGVAQSVNTQYSNFKTYEQELVTAFKYFEYHFPNRPIPEVITYISTFRQLALTLDTSILGIGLDLHLGRDYDLYPSTGSPAYLVNRFEPANLTSHAMKVWAQELFAEPLEKRKLIDKMVYHGKILYFLDLVLPEVHDTSKTGYTAQQLDWVHKSEKQIWSFFIEKKLLYASESGKYRSYINEGPTSIGMPPKSPGKIGAWVGLQIIRKFMKENPDVTPEELFAIRDGQAILKRSKYKP